MIEDYVDREPTVARKRGEDAEKAIILQQKDFKKAENAKITTRKPENSPEVKSPAWGDNLSNLAHSGNDEDCEADEENEVDRGHGKLSKDDGLSSVMGIISKTVQQHMKIFQCKNIRIDELTQLEWEDVAHSIHDRNGKYGKTKLKILTVVQLQPEKVGATPALRVFGKLMETVDIISRRLRILHGTS